MPLTAARHLWPYLQRGLLLFLLGASVIFIANLIQEPAIDQILSLNETMPTEKPMAKNNEMPEPIHTVNRRAIYKDRPDFWGWQPPWFQNIPATNEMKEDPFPIQSSLFSKIVFKPNPDRTAWGGNQFLVQIGPTQAPWMIVPGQGRLKMVSLNQKGISESFTLNGMDRNLKAITTIDLNQDGIDEILVGSPTTNTVWIFNRAAHAQKIDLSQRLTFDTEANAGVRWIAFGRLDRERRPTLLVATEYDLLAYSIEEGKIKEEKPPSRVASFWGIESLLVYDWTGDGEDEILIADWDSVMSLLAIRNGELIELDHIEFPVQLFTDGRRSPTFFKRMALSDGEGRPTLLVYEGFSPGRATQRFYLLDYNHKENQLVLRPYRSPKLLGHHPRTGWETHLEDIFPIDLNGDKQDELILLHQMKGPNPRPDRFRLELLWFDSAQQIWFHDSDTEIGEGMDPRLGTIMVGRHKIILGYNQAIWGRDGDFLDL